MHASIHTYEASRFLAVIARSLDWKFKQECHYFVFPPSTLNSTVMKMILLFKDKFRANRLRSQLRLVDATTKKIYKDWFSWNPRRRGRLLYKRI